ncbi:hypothetical protein BD779DRAFT_1470357 [Infundibulicybe gibba]|nr:hypothetical protein BD779DRAFT_1470357 [Infundibulicybe gibba]
MSYIRSIHTSFTQASASSGSWAYQPAPSSSSSARYPPGLGLTHPSPRRRAAPAAPFRIHPHPQAPAQRPPSPSRRSAPPLPQQHARTRIHTPSAPSPRFDPFADDTPTPQSLPPPPRPHASAIQQQRLQTVHIPAAPVPPPSAADRDARARLVAGLLLHRVHTAGRPRRAAPSGPRTYIPSGLSTVLAAEALEEGEDGIKDPVRCLRPQLINSTGCRFGVLVSKALYCLLGTSTWAWTERRSAATMEQGHDRTEEKGRKKVEWELGGSDWASTSRVDGERLAIHGRTIRHHHGSSKPLFYHPCTYVLITPGAILILHARPPMSTNVNPTHSHTCSSDSRLLSSAKTIFGLLSTPSRAKRDAMPGIVRVGYNEIEGTRNVTGSWAGSLRVQGQGDHAYLTFLFPLRECDHDGTHSPPPGHPLNNNNNPPNLCAGVKLGVAGRSGPAAALQATNVQNPKRKALPVHQRSRSICFLLERWLHLYVLDRSMVDTKLGDNAQKQRGEEAEVGRTGLGGGSDEELEAIRGEGSGGYTKPTVNMSVICLSIRCTNGLMIDTHRPRRTAGSASPPGYIGRRKCKNSPNRGCDLPVTRRRESRGHCRMQVICGNGPWLGFHHGAQFDCGLPETFRSVRFKDVVARRLGRKFDDDHRGEARATYNHVPSASVFALVITAHGTYNMLSLANLDSLSKRDATHRSGRPLLALAQRAYACAALTSTLRATTVGPRVGTGARARASTDK